jgi:hypothetical protein
MEAFSFFAESSCRLSDGATTSTLRFLNAASSFSLFSAASCVFVLYPFMYFSDADCVTKPVLAWFMTSWGSRESSCDLGCNLDFLALGLPEGLDLNSPFGRGRGADVVWEIGEGASSELLNRAEDLPTVAEFWLRIGVVKAFKAPGIELLKRGE